MRLQYRAHRQSTIRFFTRNTPIINYFTTVQPAWLTQAKRFSVLMHCSGPMQGFFPKRKSSLAAPSRSALRLPPKPALKEESAVPALSEEKCRGGAASPALAIEHVFFSLVEHAESVADFRQRDIDGTRKLVILILRWVTHVDPLGPVGDLVARLFRGYAVQQRFPEELGKVLPGKSEKHSVGFHRDRGVAFGFRHQRFLAKSVAGLQLGKQHRDSSDHALDLAPAGFDHEVEVPFGALANHRIAFCDVDALEAAQQLVDVSRRQLRERAVLEAAYAEHSRQESPVGERTSLVLGPHLSRRGVGGRGFIPDRHDVEKIIIDAHQLDFGNRLGAREGLAPPAERISRTLGAALQHFRRPVRIGELQLPPHEIDHLPFDAAHQKWVRVLARGFRSTETDEFVEPRFR